MEVNKKEVGKRIQHIRLDMELNKVQFGKLIGITSQHLGTTENGITGISIEKLATICEISNMSADYILFGKKDNLIQKELIDLVKHYTEKDLDMALDIVKVLLKYAKK